MIKRLVFSASLIAGAFLLPAQGNAAVTGICSNCHTMHNSQNGSNSVLPADATGPHDHLLNGGGCEGCHVLGGDNDDTGRSASGKPQVDNIYPPANYVLNAGYFTVDGGAIDTGNPTVNIDNIQHNISGVTSQDGALANTPPGASGPLSGQLYCTNCHSNSGHHATVPNTYRMLAGVNNTDASAQNDWGAAAGPAYVGTRHEINYQATQMNALCGSCHSDFHGGASNIGGHASSQENGTGIWLRHPTDIQVSSAEGPSIENTLTNNSTELLPGGASVDVIVLGSTAVPPTRGVADVDGTLMCITCHLPHGGRYADLLSFDYSANQAGGTRSVGCETCHSYSNSGM